MRNLLTTLDIRPREKFQFWQNAVWERFTPHELVRIGEEPFEATLEGASIGSLSISRITQTAVKGEATPSTIRLHQKHDTVPVIMMLAGTLATAQLGRESLQQPGDFVVLDRKPATMLTKERNRALILEVPRRRLEQMLGGVSKYAGLTVGAEQAATHLVTSFVHELTQFNEQLSIDSADRMSSIAIDLIVAGLSERMARETPRSLTASLLFRKATAYIEANLSDPTLDPSQLAAAMGVSLRRLQQLFREQGENISDRIWQRRLELAASRLASPGYLHLSLGMMAYECGFISQSHFSRRFKDRYGMSPGDYRASMVVAKSDRRERT